MSHQETRSNYIDTLKLFFANGGLMDKNRPPHHDEPFYREYISQKIMKMNIHVGDKVCVEVHMKPLTVIGTVIEDIGPYCISLLTSGKKRHKNGSNITNIMMDSVLNVQILERASDEFEPTTINPQYIPAIQREQMYNEWCRECDSVKREIHLDDATTLRRLFPKHDIHKYYYLCLDIDFIWMYNNGTITSEITITKKNGEKISVPKTLVRNVYPNRKYHSTCMRGADYVLIPFQSIEELQEIQSISCLWTIELGVNDKIRILGIDYPEFIASPFGYNIFTIHMQNSSFSSYTEFLEGKFTALNLVEQLFLQHDAIGFYSNGDIQFIREPVAAQAESMLSDTYKLLGKDYPDNVIAFPDKNLGYTEFTMKHSFVKPSYHFGDSTSLDIDTSENVRKLPWITRF